MPSKLLEAIQLASWFLWLFRVFPFGFLRPTTTPSLTCDLVAVFDCHFGCHTCTPPDIDGCQGNPCDSIANTTSGSCTDRKAPDTGFDCGCTSGFAWQGNQSACVGEWWRHSTLVGGGWAVGLGVQQHQSCDCGVFPPLMHNSSLPVPPCFFVCVVPNQPQRSMGATVLTAAR